MAEFALIARVVGALSTAYGRSADSDVLEFWAQALDGLSDEQIEKAASQGARIWAKMPTPKELLELAHSISAREQCFRRQGYDAEQSHPNLTRLARRAGRSSPEFRAEFHGRAWSTIQAMLEPERTPEARERKLRRLWAMDQDYPGSGWLEAFSDLRAEYESAGKLQTGAREIRGGA